MPSALIKNVLIKLSALSVFGSYFFRQSQFIPAFGTAALVVCLCAIFALYKQQVTAFVGTVNMRIGGVAAYMAG
jgi:predicted neutral ceramidase superfamily lipid hydrolase